MINRAVLVGRLTDDIEVKYTQSGVAVGSFNLAVNRQFKKDNGEREADFIRCVIWRKAAETLAQYTHKGSQIAIDGRIQTRNYENQQGQKVYVTEVIVENFGLLDSKGGSQNNQQNDYSQGQQQQQQSGSQNNKNEYNYDYNKKNNINQNQGDPFKDNGTPIDISDDDFPF